MSLKPVLLLLVATYTVLPSLAAAQGSDKMRRANDAAATLVRERLQHESPAEAKLLAQVGQHDIVVVRGVYDHVETVLSALGMRFTLVAAHQVAKLDLNAKQLVLVNCPGNIGTAGREKLMRFVRAGGVLYTTDWALANLVQRAFPRTIQWNGVSTTDDVVGISVKNGQDPMLKNFVLAGARPRWWLEGSSYPIKILDAQRVEVLITSREMKSKYGASPIAVTFPVEDGRVFHVVSHFYLQRNQGGRAVAASSMLKGVPSIAGKAKAKLEKQLDGLQAGDVESAYAMQQMTTNMVISKQKQNAELDRVYDKKAKRGLALEPSPEPAPAALGSARPAAVRAGEQLKVLEKKGARTRVRDLRGNEGWVNAADL